MSYSLFKPTSDSPREELKEHLNSWGLRKFSDEASYFQWQKKVFAEPDIVELNRLSLARDGGGDDAVDIHFYDLAARANILPALYSQRYDYFLEIGCAILERIEPARRVLDFGCGVGILTSFYAECFPHITFVGADRSSASIVRAREDANSRGLANLHYECRHVPYEQLSDSFDLIISTQTLFQAEREPGLPSQRWDTFVRRDDPDLQISVEARTGLKDRLESLFQFLSPEGRMLLCEKAWHLGRRILLQRALANRGFHLVRQPVLFQYRTIDESVSDGPLFEISRTPTVHGWSWDEQPIREGGASFFTLQGEFVDEVVSCLTEAEHIQTYSLWEGTEEAVTLSFSRWHGCLSFGLVRRQSGFRGIILGSPNEEEVLQEYFVGADTSTQGEIHQAIKNVWPPSLNQGDESALPAYENHTAFAQEIWKALPERQVQAQETFQETEGREMHIELGTSGTFSYLYWANTFDQRQLILMPPDRANELHRYFQESLLDMKRDAQGKSPPR